MRRREGNIAFRTAFGELLFIQPIDRAAGDVFDRHAGRGGELLADEVVDHIAPAAAPDADDELVLRHGLHRRQEQSQRSDDHANPFHVPPFRFARRSVRCQTDLQRLEQHLSISGSSLFVETAELVQRRGKAAALGGVAPRRGRRTRLG